MDAGDFPLVARDLSVDGIPWGVGPRRAVIDRILLEAAIAAGAEVSDGFAVEEVLTGDGRVTGVRASSARTGKHISVDAHLTIGADGRHSRIAESVRAPFSVEVPSLTCWYFSYWSGVPMDGIELRAAGRRASFIFPTNDDLTAVFTAWPIDEYPTVRRDPAEQMLAALELSSPELAERVRAGQREERMYGTPDVPNYLRQAWGPGWALVGDAGCHKDPMLALGMAHALRDAELLATAVDSGLSGAQPLDQALSEFEVRRNAATLPEFEENLQWARMDPPPAEVLALRAALGERPDDARMFALANFGSIPRELFFNPDNLARIMGPMQKAA
jgi:flavin-dependent dehydrogenase